MEALEPPVIFEAEENEEKVIETEDNDEEVFEREDYDNKKIVEAGKNDEKIFETDDDDVVEAFVKALENDENIFEVEDNDEKMFEIEDNDEMIFEIEENGEKKEIQPKTPATINSQPEIPYLEPIPIITVSLPSPDYLGSGDSDSQTNSTENIDSDDSNKDGDLSM